jgi:predicted dehydrogenase
MHSAQEELGVCVVGTGDIGTFYLRAWRAADGARVVSVADIDEERAQQAAENFSAESWHTDYRDAIVADGVDVVCVCTPTMLHPEVTIAAAEQGRHVLCVKPIALTLEDADRMIEAAESAGVQFCVGFMRRYTPSTRLVRDSLGAESVGRPAFYSVTSRNGIRPKILMHDVNANGGPVIDMCCHWIDVARVYFDSEPVRVMAQGMTFATDRPELASIETKALDTASISVGFESGDILSIDISWGLAPNQGPETVEQIWGPSGRIAGLTFESSLTVIHDEQSKRTIEMQRLETFQDATNLLVEDFLAAVRGEMQLPVTGEDGRRALEVSLAALESIETGRAIELS